jgi:hypothetical protein
MILGYVVKMWGRNLSGGTIILVKNEKEICYSVFSSQHNKFKCKDFGFLFRGCSRTTLFCKALANAAYSENVKLVFRTVMEEKHTSALHEL